MVQLHVGAQAAQKRSVVTPEQPALCVPRLGAVLITAVAEHRPCTDPHEVELDRGPDGLGPPDGQQPGGVIDHFLPAPEEEQNGHGLLHVVMGFAQGALELPELERVGKAVLEIP